MDGHPQHDVRSIIEWAGMPFRERVTDRLADLLLDADDILQMLEADESAHDFRWIEPDIREVYENVNALMTSLCD